MAVIVTKYDHLWSLFVRGGINLSSDTIKIALVTSSYTPSISHTAWADASANEVTSGNGYTTGGIALANPVITARKADFDDVTWTALTKSFRYAVCYLSATRLTIVNPLLFYMLLDSTPQDVVSSGSNYKIEWSATNGVFYRP